MRGASLATDNVVEHLPMRRDGRIPISVYHVKEWRQPFEKIAHSFSIA